MAKCIEISRDERRETQRREREEPRFQSRQFDSNWSVIAVRLFDFDVLYLGPRILYIYIYIKRISARKSAEFHEIDALRVIPQQISRRGIVSHYKRHFSLFVIHIIFANALRSFRKSGEKEGEENINTYIACRES